MIPEEFIKQETIDTRRLNRPPPSMWFCHMDVDWGKGWTEGETIKTFSKETALENFKEVQALREKGVLVKNLKLCRLAINIEKEEEEEKIE
jgi:hypothetical protein